jgi:hypothetical protein
MQLVWLGIGSIHHNRSNHRHHTPPALPEIVTMEQLAATQSYLQAIQHAGWSGVYLPTQHHVQSGSMKHSDRNRHPPPLCSQQRKRFALKRRLDCLNTPLLPNTSSYLSGRSCAKYNRANTAALLSTCWQQQDQHSQSCNTDTNWVSRLLLHVSRLLAESVGNVQ